MRVGDQLFFQRSQNQSRVRSPMTYGVGLPLLVTFEGHTERARRNHRYLQEAGRVRMLTLESSLKFRGGEGIDGEGESLLALGSGGGIP